MGKDSKKDKKKRKHADHSDDSDADRERLKKSTKKIEKITKMLGYTNDTNPFGDSNLLQPFVWKKREEKELLSSAVSGGKKDKKHSGSSNGGGGGGDKRLELVKEIEKVRKRREDRERELEETERLRTEEQRLREMASFGDWHRKEEEFHTEQIRIRSTLRLIEQRFTAVDLLAKNILLVNAATAIDNNVKEERDNNERLLQLDAELRDPLTILSSESPEELAQAQRDIGAYIELEAMRNGPYLKYWESIQTIAAGLRKASTTSNAAVSTTAVHASLAAEVEALLEGKSSVELDRLQQDIASSLRSGGDRDYWERMQQEVALQRAKAYAGEVHASLLAEHLTNLRQKHEELRGQHRAANDNDDDHGDGNEEGSGAARLADDSREAIAMLRSEKGKGLENAEEAMVDSDEVMLPGATYWWQDKYRPRKPRYFNRVRLGFDWNKYNSTHYDRDNPPPKMIQGYKFTIFFPDLIDKTVAPKFFLEAVPGTDDFAILRFHAGPPYEDIAFQIINREWDRNPRSGYRCVFERGILQLNFSFKRRWYRR